MGRKVIDIELKEFKEIFKDHLNDQVFFSVYCDSIFTYDLFKGADIWFEICIISDDVFYDAEHFIDLLDKRNISYFAVTKYNNGKAISDSWSYRPLIKEKIE